SDSNGRGFLYAGGSGALETFVNQIGKHVTDPETGVSVIARRRAAALVRQLEHPPKNPADRISANPDKPMPLYALGSGSDYASFLDHFGLATLSLGFGGETEGTQYHSRYDSWYWYSHFGDPGFQYGVALAKVAGHAVLRFADAPILPYRFGNFARDISNYVKEIEKLHATMQKMTRRKNALIEADAFELASDPTKTYVPPEPKPAVPDVDFSPLEKAVARLESAARAYDKAFAEHGDSLDAGAREKLNSTLLTIGRELLYEDGLPRRGWFRNMVYAPGYYTGYGVKTLPGVREAVEHRDWDTAKKYIDIVAAALDDYSARIEKATAILTAAG
ncbi:MAG: folate hydrolase, partial [Gammaproteobacteria bacterium]|nr:folate hydrolase [Gammaproteobacteria bacterium]